MTSRAPDLSVDPRLALRDRPAYPVTEAARYAGVSASTLRRWVVGRPYRTHGEPRPAEALIRPADARRLYLSFLNLVDAYLLRALRAAHDAPLAVVRAALHQAGPEHGPGGVTVSGALSALRRERFVEAYGRSVGLSPSGAIAMRAVLDAYLARIDWDEAGALPVRFYPFVTVERGDAPRRIVIDPAVGFGRPIVRSRSIATRVIADRIDVGETVGELAEDYGLDPEEVAEAIVYERAA